MGTAAEIGSQFFFSVRDEIDGKTLLPRRAIYETV
jgi:hypothetical protein